MAGAAETILGIGQQNQRSMEFLTNSISSGFANMAKAQNERSDMYQNMFRSALALKQQQQDAYFKKEALKLDYAQLAVTADHYQNSFDLAKEKMQNDLAIANINANARSISAANKGPLSVLSAERIAAGTQLSSIQKIIANNNNIAEIGRKNLDYLKNNSPTDYHGEKGNAIRAKIDKAENDNMMHSQKMIDLSGRFEAIGSSISAIGAGADAEPILQSLHHSYGDVGAGMLIPTTERTSVDLQPSGSNTDWSPKASSVPNTVPIKILNNLFGSNKDIIKPDAPPPPKLNINQLMETLKDPKVNPAAKQSAIKYADPDATAKLEQFQNRSMVASLLNYAAASNYGSKEDDKFFTSQREDNIKDYISFGGEVSKLTTLTGEAQAKLNELKSDPKNQGIDTDSKGVESPDGIPVYGKVKAAYDAWVYSQVAPKKEEIKGQGITDASGRLGDSIDPENNIFHIGKGVDLVSALTGKNPFFSKDSSSVEVVPRKKTFDGEVSNENIKTQFDKNFTKSDKFNNQSFADWLNRDKISASDLGISKNTYNSYGDVIEKDPDLVEQQRVAKIKEITSSKEKSLEWYKKLYGKQ